MAPAILQRSRGIQNFGNAIAREAMMNKMYFCSSYRGTPTYCCKSAIPRSNAKVRKYLA